MFAIQIFPERPVVLLKCISFVASFCQHLGSASKVTPSLVPDNTFTPFNPHKLRGTLNDIYQYT